MKCQIISASKYGSTTQNMLWIKERLDFENNFEVKLNSIEEKINLEDSELVILATGIYSGQAYKGFNEFIEKNIKQLKKKKLIFISVAMEKSNCFNENNILRTIKDFYDELEESIIMQEVLLGEMVHPNMDGEDKNSIYSFYETWMKLKDDDLKKALLPKTLLNKKEAWELAFSIINNCGNEK